MHRDGSRVLLLEAVERRHRREEDAEPDVDEVDVGDRERDVAAQDDAFVEHAVDELEQRELLRESGPFDDAHPGVSSVRTKLYGGHGPVSSNVMPSLRSAPSTVPTSSPRESLSAGTR